MCRAQRGVQTPHLPGAYGGAALDWPPCSHSPSSSILLASISAVSPVSLPPLPPLPSQPRPPELGEELFLEEPRDAKPANGKRRDAEIGVVDGKVGGKESRGAGLSIKVTWGRRGSALGAREQGGPASVSPRKLGARVCKNPATCSLFPGMKILRFNESNSETDYPRSLLEGD